MQSRIADFRSTDAKIFAICTDPVEKNAEVVDQLQLDYAILSDPELIAIDRFDLRHKGGNPMESKDIARPAVFVLDRNGVVQWRSLTDNYRVRVRSETVLEQLRAIP